MEITESFSNTPILPRVVIIMGSASDGVFARKISDEAERLGLKAILKVSSAHKVNRSIF